MIAEATKCPELEPSGESRSRSESGVSYGK